MITLNRVGDKFDKFAMFALLLCKATNSILLSQGITA